MSGHSHTVIQQQPPGGTIIHLFPCSCSQSNMFCIICPPLRLLKQHSARNAGCWRLINLPDNLPHWLLGDGRGDCGRPVSHLSSCPLPFPLPPPTSLWATTVSSYKLTTWNHLHTNICRIFLQILVIIFSSGISTFILKISKRIAGAGTDKTT